ncbi:MAG: cation acetate symporter [Micromonosporaceae bacterium]|nr:cation acetate symporter [Micromonosporaceae bacterium]
MVNPYALPAVLAVTAVTVVIGAYGLRLARSTSDLLVASRTVSPRWNAAAISGEYLSAASFLGVAGLVLKEGVDMLWYPVGFAAGYLALLLFVAAPLRRSGAFTLPDFCELRLGSTRMRKLSAVFVIFIGWLYLVPQFQGAGLTLQTVMGWPYYVGSLLVAAVVTGNVALGGMRSITFVQAFQYWLKLTALAVPVIFLLLHWQAQGRPEVTPPTGNTFLATTTVHFDAPAVLTVTTPTTVTVAPSSTPRLLQPGKHTFAAGSDVTFPAGATVPQVSGTPDATGWLHPGTVPGGLFATYSLIFATFLGTMGLPHVLVRFYTNPDGAAARRTTLVVLGLVGLFYLFPTLYGVLGRVYAPALMLTGDTDAVVLVLPGLALGHGLAGQLLGALVAAGGFAAFLSSSSGLLTSVAGVFSTDVLGRGSVVDFRRGALIGGLVPFILSLTVAALDVSMVVGLAFAVAASSFCPLLVLGIWWRGLTDVGAMAGILVGGGGAAVAVLLTFLGYTGDGLLATLLHYPGAWTVPLAFTVMVGVSLATRRRVPSTVGLTMLRLHAPEALRPRAL